MEPRDLLVEVLGQHVDFLLVLARVAVQLDLRHHLVGKAGRHHEARVTRRAAQVEQAAFRQDHHAVAVGEDPLIVLRLDVDPLDSRRLLEPGHVDLVVEVADVADNGLVLHPRHMRGGEDVEVAGGSDKNVGGGDHVIHRTHLEAFHRGLQGADRVDFGNQHARALALERLRATLADLAVAADHRELARQHDVGGAIEPVDDRMPAAVDVVELRFGDRVVHVDGGEEQRACLHHFVEAVHPRRRLFGNPANGAREPGPAARILFRFGAQQIQDHAPFLGVAGRIERGNLPRLLEFGALVDQQRGIAAVIEQQVGAAAVGPQERLLGAPPVLFQSFSLPGKDRGPARLGFGSIFPDYNRGGRVVLGRENVAGYPAHIGPELDQRLDQHRGLYRHMQGAHDAGAGERPLALVLGADGHEARHLLLGKPDLLAAEFGEGQVLHLEGGAGGG